MPSSIPAAIDYLAGLAEQTATQVDGLLTCEGWPAVFGDFMFGVASDAPPTHTTGSAASGVVTYDIGQVRFTEQFGVPCWIYRHVGGTSSKPARDDVFAAFNAFVALLRTDLTLGGALAIGEYAGLGEIHLQGPATEDEAAKGRYALLLFSVTGENRY